MRAVAPQTSHTTPPPFSRICSQCELLRELFNLFMAADDMPVRHLDAMLLLGDDPDVRKAFSFLCAGGGHLHGPLALSLVDPAVVPMDFDHCPPCKWHWAVNMASDLMDHFRQELESGRGQRAKAKVPHRPSV